MQTHIINGLVLIGGQSNRMGTDKSKLVYHGENQRVFAQRLLSDYCNEVYFSCNSKQVSQFGENEHVIVDNYHQIGPMAAILSAFEFNPQTAWLVIACDMPLVTGAVISKLIQNRAKNKMATAFESPVTGELEPLIAIWEPASYDALKRQQLLLQYSLKKAMANLNIELLSEENETAFLNVNSPDDHKKILEQLNSR